MTAESESEGAIRRLIENWAIWRDTGDWKRLATAWTPEGRMVATWFDGPATEFIAASRAGFAKGAIVQHVLGGSSVRISAGRAVADTRATLHLRAAVEGVLCDITCIGRFIDFLEHGNAGWAIALRKLAYEKDRLDTVGGGAPPQLDETLLAQFPSGYRYLAYTQARAGMTVNLDLPGYDSNSFAVIESWKTDWLDGKPLLERAT